MSEPEARASPRRGSRKARYTKSDMDRILKAAKDARLDVRVKIAPDGTIIIETGSMATSNAEQYTPEKLLELVKDAH